MRVRANGIAVGLIQTGESACGRTNLDSVQSVASPRGFVKGWRYGLLGLRPERSPVAENLDYRSGRCGSEWPVVLAPFARGYGGGVLVRDNKLRVTAQEFMRLLGRLF